MHGFIVLDGTPPPEILKRGRQQVRQYGGQIVFGAVVSTAPAAPLADGDLRFTVTLTDGRTLTARRVLVARPARRAAQSVRPGRAPGPHLTYFTRGTDLDSEPCARFAARNIRIVETDVKEVVNDDGGALAGVHLTDGAFVERRVTQMQARTEGLERLKLPMEDLPDNMGRRFTSAVAGTTEIPGAWMDANATDLTAQVGASAAAGALAGSRINAVLAAADTDAALAATQKSTG